MFTDVRKTIRFQIAGRSWSCWLSSTPSSSCLSPWPSACLSSHSTGRWDGQNCNSYFYHLNIFFFRGVWPPSCCPGCPPWCKYLSMVQSGRQFQLQWRDLSLSFIQEYGELSWSNIVIFFYRWLVRLIVIWNFVEISQNLNFY